MIYELLIVDVVPGKLQEFQDYWLKVSLPVWERHGVKHIGSWETIIGNSNEVVRLFAYNDFSHYEQWNNFLTKEQEGKELRKKLYPYLIRTHRRILQAHQVTTS